MLYPNIPPLVLGMLMGTLLHILVVHIVVDTGISCTKVKKKMLFTA